MAAQPANTTISVAQRLRTVAVNRRQTSIKHLMVPFDGFYVPAPGEEIQVLETRDLTFRTDAFRLGHPVVVYPRTECTLASVVNGVNGLDIPVRLPGNGREIQIQKDHDHLADDLHANARTVCAGGAYV